MKDDLDALLDRYDDVVVGQGEDYDEALAAAEERLPDQYESMDDYRVETVDQGVLSLVGFNFEESSGGGAAGTDAVYDTLDPK